MKIIANLNIDDGWTDVPEVFPAYIFNNMKDLLDYFNTISVVEIIKEPSPNNIYDFGEIIISEIHGHRYDLKLIFTTMYAKD